MLGLHICPLCFQGPIGLDGKPVSKHSGFGLLPVVWSRSLAWGLLDLLQDPNSLGKALGRMTNIERS